MAGRAVGPTPNEQVKAERGFLSRLRASLEESGMSQAELAIRVGCGPSTVTEWFQRGSLPKGHIMIHLPRVLGVSASWLISGEGASAPELADPRDKARRERTGLEVMAMMEGQLAELREQWVASCREQRAASAAAEDVAALDDLARKHPAKAVRGQKAKPTRAGIR